MEKTEQIDQLAKALCEAQAKFMRVEKDSQNTFTKSEYASLSAVLTAVQKGLAESGLAIMQLVGDGDLKTVLMHKSGQYISTTTKLVGVDPKSNHSFGSAITYARRYSLCSILNLGFGTHEEDDDGNSSTSAPPATEKQLAFIKTLGSAETIRSAINELKIGDPSKMTAQEASSLIKRLQNAS